MDVWTWTSNFAGAEGWADQYKGDTGTEERVRVVEELPTGKFLVVIGDVDDSDQYEVQYEA
jgi:hypothetical protein